MLGFLKKNKTALIACGAMTIICLPLFGKSLYKYAASTLRGTSTIESVSKELALDAQARLQPAIKQLGLDDLPDRILLLGLKEEQRLEVYARTSKDWQRLKTYPFTANSGELGPKLQEGDRQIPEGLYEIELLNPNSSYHLSLRVNYPNAFDRAKTRFADISDMGGDIYIHGKAVSIGCIAIGDEAIEEVFLLATKALPQGIDVIISPRDFRKNPDEPEINNIDWGRALYGQIKTAIKQLPENE